MALVRPRSEGNVEREQIGRGGDQWFEEGGIGTNWFGGGRSIIFKGKNNLDFEKKEPWYLFTIPADCLYQCFILQQTQNNNHNKKMKMFSHLLHHTFLLRFDLAYNTVPPQFAGLYDASWVVLGSTIYFFGAKGRKIYYLKEDVTSTTFPSSVTFGSAGRMTSKRRAPKVVALDGKIYVFGDHKYVFGEVFEPHPDSLKGRSRPLSSPYYYCGLRDIQFALAIEEERKIVVGINYEFVEGEQLTFFYPDVKPTGTSVFVYDVVKDSWERNKSSLFLNKRRIRIRCQPIAVGSCLYWVDTQMWAYDLVTKQYFEGPVEDCLFQHSVEYSQEDNSNVSLLHVAGDFFCMTWVDFHDSSVIHCTTIQSLKTTISLQANRFKLRTSVLSCQTFASGISVFLQNRALVL